MLKIEIIRNKISCTHTSWKKTMAFVCRLQISFAQLALSEKTQMETGTPKQTFILCHR